MGFQPMSGRSGRFCADERELSILILSETTPRWTKRQAGSLSYSVLRGSNSRLIKAGGEEGKRNWKPNKEGRVIRIISAVVVTSVIISAAPIAPALSSVSVVSVTSATIAAVIVPVAAGMSGGMTGMGATGLRRSNSEEGEQNKTQCCYGFHVNYRNSVVKWQTLELFADGSSSYLKPTLTRRRKYGRRDFEGARFRSGDRNNRYHSSDKAKLSAFQ